MVNSLFDATKTATENYNVIAHVSGKVESIKVEKGYAKIISRINGFTYVETKFDYFTGKLEVRSRTPYTTVPLGIIHKRDVTITVCYYETNMMIDFLTYQQKRCEGFVDYVDMTFRLFLSSAVWYLKRLKQINALIEKAKRNLDKGVNK